MSDSPAGAGFARERWKSRFGFILATIGAAAGLGNIWRFSYVAGENGGGAFLLTYLVCVIVVGLPLVVAEIAIGRRSRAGAVETFRRLAPGTLWIGAGYLGIAAAFIILSYYGVVAGWALRYLIASLGLAGAGAGHASEFAEFVSHPVAPVLWQAAMMALATVVVAGGVRDGIERVNKVLMPLLGLILVVLAAFSVTLDSARGGLAFLFSIESAAFSDPNLYLAALGQAFFSLGVGMALFITYGSYLTDRSRVLDSSVAVAGGDSLLAIVAGVAIFPAVFAFGLDAAAGPELAFVTLPELFRAMPGGSVVAPAFFGLLVAGALTSMVALLEIPTAHFSRRYPRRPTAFVLGIVIFLLGIPASLGFGVLSGIEWNGRGILDSIDFFASNLLLPTGGLIVALFAGWIWPKAEALAEANFRWPITGWLWRWLLRVVAPAAILLILLNGIGVL